MYGYAVCLRQPEKLHRLTESPTVLRGSQLPKIKDGKTQLKLEKKNWLYLSPSNLCMFIVIVCYRRLANWNQTRHEDGKAQQAFQSIGN